jgi:ABC-2 type transport system permease protein
MTAATQAATQAAPAGFGRQFAVLAGRNLRQARAGRSIGLTVIFPLTFFAGFMIVFKRLMSDFGIAYEQFLPPAIVVQTTVLVAMSACYMVAGDSRSGLISRYRTLPMGSAVVPLARLVVDAVRAAVAVAVILVASVIAGFRFTAGAAGAVGFVLLAVGFAVVLAAGCAALGLSAKDPEHVYSALTLPYLILVTISTAYVPVHAFPGWLQPVVRVSPISAEIDALRALSTRDSTVRVWPAVAWLVGLGLLFGFAAARSFRRTR